MVYAESSVLSCHVWIMITHQCSMQLISVHVEVFYLSLLYPVHKVTRHLFFFKQINNCLLYRH